MGRVKQAITDCIGEGRVRDVVVPLPRRQLAGDDGRASAGPILQDLEEITAALIRERAERPIVEDEDVDARED